ncbi:hypothetical protein niasHT_034988 [Heterodera trifolii]|uniref:Uncharacterized protein n=1 Tax=Heterodera trifolii TaxID=157864 RepID=A0ABD2I8M2_9BILA
MEKQQQKSDQKQPKSDQKQKKVAVVLPRVVRKGNGMNGSKSDETRRSKFTADDLLVMQKIKEFHEKNTAEENWHLKGELKRQQLATDLRVLKLEAENKELWTKLKEQRKDTKLALEQQKLANQLRTSKLEAELEQQKLANQLRTSKLEAELERLANELRTSKLEAELERQKLANEFKERLMKMEIERLNERLMKTGGEKK